VSKEAHGKKNETKKCKTGREFGKIKTGGETKSGGEKKYFCNPLSFAPHAKIETRRMYTWGSRRPLKEKRAGKKSP
jgi:hypothetical protein